MNQSTSQLANLKRGGVAGRKKKAPIKITEKVSKLLEKQLDNFVIQMASLTPKEYVDTYLRLMKQVLPKQLQIQTNEASPLPVFTIVVAGEESDATDEDIADYHGG